MTASVLRSRMLRKHPKRNPGLIGDAIANVFDSAKGKAQGHADILPPSMGSNRSPDFPTNGLGNQGKNENSGSDSGRNGGQGNGGGKDSSGGDSSSNNGNGSSNNGNGNTNPNPNSGNSGGINVPLSGSSEGGSGGSQNTPASNSGSTGGGSDGGNSGSSIDNTDSSTGLNPPSTSPVADASNEPGTASTHHSGTSSSPSPSIFASAIVSTGAAVSTPGALFSDTASIPSATSTNPAPQSDVSQSSNRGAIAGGIVGALLFLFLMYGAWLVYKRRRKNQLPPSAEFANNPSAYPFAHAGFGNTATADEKTGASGGKYGGAGTGAAGQAKFKPFSADSAEGMLSEKGPQMGQYRDNYSQPLPPPPQPEVLYTTPARVVTPPNAPNSAPSTPTTPSGRRIPFGTGTFQFPPRPPQPQPQPR